MLASKGFGAEVRQALAERDVFLMEQGLAERGQRVTRRVDQAVRAIDGETGLVHRPVADGYWISMRARY